MVKIKQYKTIKSGFYPLQALINKYQNVIVSNRTNSTMAKKSIEIRYYRGATPDVDYESIGGGSSRSACIIASLISFKRIMEIEE